MSADALIERIAAALPDARQRMIIEGEILAAAAELPGEERVRLKQGLSDLGLKTRDWWGLVGQRVTALRRLRVVEPNENASTKPTVIVKAGELAWLTRRALELLGEREDVFAREGEFVTTLAPDGLRAFRIAPLELDTVRVLLADAARWLTFEADGPVPIDPPHNAVAGAFRCPWKKGVRALEQVVEAPTIRPDGSIVVEPGYDEAMRLLYAPNAEFPAIPDAPTKGDASGALHAIREIFEDFPCESESDRSVLIAVVLTMLCRGAIAGAVPAFAVSANSKGTGKTKALAMACILGTGRSAEAKGWPVEEAELEKGLDTAAIEGAPYLFYDNLEAPFAGATLCGYLTATVARPRDFGKKRTITCPWKTIVLATGNNLQLGRDIDRRTIVCRMLVEDERPWLRPESAFKHPNLEAWVMAERPRLVVAALTLVRAWIQAGRPRGSQPTLGSFEAWSRFVPDAIEWAGGVNPLERTLSRPDEGETDEDRAFGTILRDLQRLDIMGHGLSAKDIRKRLYPGDAPPKADEAPDGFDSFRDALETCIRKTNARGVPDAVALGRWLGMRKNQRRGKLRLVADGGHNNVWRWIAQPV